jgi:hypothetical protein
MKKPFKDIIPTEMLCQRCKIRVGQKLHSCPLAEVFEEESKESKQCNCCTSCESKCLDEV